MSGFATETAAVTSSQDTASPAPRAPGKATRVQDGADSGWAVPAGKAHQDALGRLGIGEAAPASEDLKRRAGFTLSNAAVRYHIACLRVGDAVAATAKRSPSFLDYVVDILVGVLLPSAATQAIKSVIEEYVLDPKRALRLIETFDSEESIRYVATSAMRRTRTSLQSSYREILAAQTPTQQFITRLADEAVTQLQTLSETCDSLTEAQLVAIVAAYNAEVLSHEILCETILDLVHKFQEQVEPVGSEQQLSYLESGSDNDVRFAWINTAADGIKPALVSCRYPGFLGKAPAKQRETYHFIRWIDPEMVSAARQRAEIEEFFEEEEVVMTPYVRMKLW